MNKVAFIVLLALVFILPWEQYWTVQGSMETTSRLVGAVAFLTGVLGVLMGTPLRRPSLAFIFIGMFVAWSFATTFWSISPEQSLSRTSTFVMLAILLWLVYQYADSFLRIRWIMYVFIAGMIAMMCNLYLNFFFDVGLGIGGGEYRVDVAMSNANGVANYLTVVAAFAYYLIAGRGVKVNRLLKIAGWGIIIAAVVGVFLTGSRAGVIGLALSMGVTMLTAIRSGWKPAAMFILGAATAVYLVVQYVPEGTLTRVQEGTEAHTFQTRLEYWGIAYNAWLKTPIEGCGAGASGKFTPSGRSAIHNTFLSILLELGLVGLGLYLAVLGTLLMRILSFATAEKMLWLSVLANFLPHMASTSIEYQKVVWLIFAMILAQRGGGAKSPLPEKPTARTVFRSRAV